MTDPITNGLPLPAEPTPPAPPPSADLTPCQSENIENALLRGSLWLAVAALKRYTGATHVELDGDEQERLALVVSPDAPAKAAEAIVRAEAMLQRPAAERGR